MSVYVWAKTKSGKLRITPGEFLTWAETDIKGDGRREMANALTNAKRALHARIDEILYSVRVRYANDWPKWPKIVGTNLKIEVLKSLNIRITAIVKVLTERRNDLEHAYMLPSRVDVEAAVETARLWLNDTKSYLRPSIVLAGLTFKPLRNPVDRIRKEELLVTFGPAEKVLFFRDSAHTLIILKSDCTRSEKSYKELGWKNLIQYQKPYLSENNKLIVSSLSIATKIYMKYEQWLIKEQKTIIPGNFGVVLKINEVIEVI
jgi:hypothetical protein